VVGTSTVLSESSRATSTRKEESAADLALKRNKEIFAQEYAVDSLRASDWTVTVRVACRAPAARNVSLVCVVRATAAARAHAT